MNLTEEQRIFAWASKTETEEDLLCQEKEPEQDSYFTPFVEKEDIYEYGFATVPELEAQLKECWQDEEAMTGVTKVCAVAAFKNRPRKETENDETGTSANAEVEIKDFVYVF